MKLYTQWLHSVPLLVCEGEPASGIGGPPWTLAAGVANERGFTTTLFPPGEREMDEGIPE